MSEFLWLESGDNLLTEDGIWTFVDEAFVAPNHNLTVDIQVGSVVVTNPVAHMTPKFFTASITAGSVVVTNPLRDNYPFHTITPTPVGLTVSIGLVSFTDTELSYYKPTRDIIWVYGLEGQIVSAIL